MGGPETPAVDDAAFYPPDPDPITEGQRCAWRRGGELPYRNTRKRAGFCGGGGGGRGKDIFPSFLSFPFFLPPPSPSFRLHPF